MRCLCRLQRIVSSAGERRLCSFASGCCDVHHTHTHCGRSHAAAVALSAQLRAPVSPGASIHPMKAVGYQTPSPIDALDSLLDITLPDPEPSARDLLIEVKAISVNPVDAKVRASTKPADGQRYKVLGYDAAGTVLAVGRDTTLFRPSDEVFYAGSIARSGTNAERHLVDERIVGHKPATLPFAAAAALPLTSITAWELLFDRFAIARTGSTLPSSRLGAAARLHPAPSSSAGGRRAAILVIGGAGGVGSILIQLARQLTCLTVIATASRPETKQWCSELGAHSVIDHSEPMQPQLAALGLPQVEYIACLTGTGQHYPGIVDLLAPQGKIGVIDDPPTLDAKPLKRKAASLHWEFMFTRPVFETADMVAQHHLLTDVARLVDAGVLRSTHTTSLGTINAVNLKEAHRQIESGRAHGKIVLEGF